ncbi:phosphoinositide 3-kinase adapter protein 1 [Neoarius graeffei]|uniref:phosphoinositide 3-kinase adapter protein 1 n=1 Tax=Neoarius graeffei TaxID=443677 RepID=UPI00298C655C|nr:phosphoinositide 3-kinase adapter protein 1 [Neoarius graeffei]XP_060782310.1 phosphoinositide 3-kinase adapter protein 1 [Neoarius graeffei]
MCSVLIVHTSEAQDWASYLKIILEASHHFPQNSISFYLLDGEHSMQDEDYSIFSTSQCILLLISVAFIDIQSEPGVRNGLKKFLYPHSKIVAFLCGVSESDGLMDCFEDWNSWRKLDSDDEPALYIATVCEVVEEENVTNLEDKEMRENKITSPRQSMDQPALDEPQLHSDQFHSPEEAGDVSDRNLTQSRSLSASEEQKACLTVQPNRILSGTPVDIYFIMVNKLDSQDNIEVEFCCEHSTKLVSGTAVNEYIVTVQSPDMPTGEVTLHLYSNESIVCSTTVTYYTEMEEISNYLEKVMDPVNFMCQAFSITSSASEELDNLFTDSLKNQMPPNGLKVFGINQLQEDITNQRDVELPTLLHFSAKYGLKKLTSTLLQCPGALQAYSTANKNGDYPNTLAERSGFPDLRQFMDDYVETIDLVKSHIEESITTPEDEDIYEPMANSSQNFVAKFSLQEDIYESMMQLNPDMQLYEDLDSLDSSFNESQPEDAVLRKFFEVNAKKHSETEDDLGNDTYSGRRVDETEEENLEDNVENYEEEDDEDPYKCCYPDDIYDTIDDEESFASVIVNRPPAPIPRTCTSSEPEECKTYISTVFSSKNPLYSENSCKKDQTPQVRPVPERMLSSGHDPYAGMKTPGQRQLISLQERVKVGALTVEEAVQEFKAWQFDQEKRSQSIRFQQENLQKLRDSIIRRKKGKGGKVLDLDITAPVQRNLRWGSHMNVECSVYVPASGSLTQPPSVNRPPQRGTWQTGSTSSTSSSGSNRLSTLSTISNSSGAEELEEPQENVLPPPRPPRPATETPPTLPPPRIPPRLPDRYPESMLNERYVSSPARHLSHAPPHRAIPPPPTTRRPR